MLNKTVHTKKDNYFSLYANDWIKKRTHILCYKEVKCIWPYHPKEDSYVAHQAFLAYPRGIGSLSCIRYRSRTEGQPERGKSYHHPCHCRQYLWFKYRPELQGAITALIESKTDTTIEPIIPPPLASYTDKLATLVNSGGDVPDLFVVAQAMTKIPTMVAREQILDLTDYIKNSPALSQLDDSLFKDLQIDGKTYFVPYNYPPKSKAIFIRKDLMEQYGVELSSTPPTAEEFRREMGKFVGSGDHPPFNFPPKCR